MIQTMEIAGENQLHYDHFVKGGIKPYKIKGLISHNNDEHENFIIFSKKTHLIVHPTAQKSNAIFF